ncbi:MAG TPA: gluconeogenesis factor YvcK family protein [Acidimicrobiales bacterium]|nr:gluconeogenesis factor YvcK family protein [Acidimicrobiales bacterium]
MTAPPGAAGTAGAAHPDDDPARGPVVVAVGGGHGLAATIRAVRRYAGHATAVVATGDDGGSTGRLRGALDLPAPGDLRRCIEAMAGEDGSPLARALGYRFEGTDVAGHALGNLLLAGLTHELGDFALAVEEACRLAGLDPAVGRVLPATTLPVVLRVRTSGGVVVTGQVAITRTTGIERLTIDPADAPAPRSVVDALAAADQVVLGPGSLYTSVLAASVVDDVREAIAKCSGHRVYVCNVRAEAGETRDYDVADHLTALRCHGIDPDVVLCQRGALAQGHLPLGAPEVVEADVVRPHGRAHDPAKLAAALRDLLA